jgi:ribosomal protein S18 acetylase RimI-like enzyme
LFNNMSETTSSQHLYAPTGSKPTVSINTIADPKELKRDHARAVLDLMAQAYAGQFEEPKWLIPQGTFAKYFDINSTTKITEQKERMEDSLKRGSRYLFVQGAAGTDWHYWVGLAKTSPSGNQEHESPDCFLNDIAVHTSYQHQGLGSSLAHAALTDFDKERSLLLHAYLGNPTNKWFARLGLRSVAHVDSKEFKIPSRYDKGGFYETHVLHQQLYSSEGIITIGGIQKLLEEKVQPLAAS